MSAYEKGRDGERLVASKGRNNDQSKGIADNDLTTLRLDRRHNASSLSSATVTAAAGTVAIVPTV